MAEVCFTNDNRGRLYSLSIIRGTRYHGIVTALNDYDNIFRVRLDSRLGQFGFEFKRVFNKELPPLVCQLLTQREILFRKFE